MLMRITVLWAFVAVVAVQPVPAAPEGVVLCRLGRDDGDYGEFAIAGNYNAFRTRFPHGVAVDASDPSAAAKWPFIHPGPADAWAGSRAHTFRVRFNLREVPGPTARLTLGLVDTHHLAPPRLAVALNGRLRYSYALPAGASDASLTDPKQGRPHTLVIPFPASALKRGTNTLELAVVSGSWLLYDHVTCEGGLSLPTGPVVKELRASSTMLFRRVGGQLCQIVEVHVENEGVEGVALASIVGEARRPVRVRLVPGSNRLEIPVTPVSEPRDAEVALQVGEVTARAPVRILPERRWTLYVAPSSHTDIGYTDLQERAIAVHVNNTAAALRACEEIPGFCWNLEVASHIDFVTEHRPDLVPALIRAMASGRIGLQGLYLNMLTGLCSSEEMVRVLMKGGRLRGLGRRVAETASLNDVPSAVGTLPTLLAHAGFRYFTDAVNEYRGPLFRHADPRIRQAPFWWEGPDGSRVLAIMTHGYSQASTIGLMDSFEELARRLPGWLRHWERPDYPGSAVLVYGGVSDNVAMTPVYASVANEWNRRYAYPRIVVGQAGDFFRHVERESGDRLPVLKGDFGSFWEDGAGSSAYETALTRHARAQLTSAQRLLALTRRADYPKDQLDEAWRNVIFYNEHTWGAWCSVSQPDSEQTREQWARKAAFAHGAHQRTQEIVGLLGRRRPVAVPGAVRVWNAFAWPRDIVVTVPLDALPAGQGVAVQDAGGSPVPSQVETHGGNRLVFLARSVPGLGYADYRVVPGVASGEALLQQGATSAEWLTPGLRMELDLQTGAVVSLRERSTGLEWVRPRDGRALNEFLYVTGGEGSSVINQNLPEPTLDVRTHTRAEVSLVENGPVRSVLRVVRRGEGVPPVDTWIVLEATGRVHFRNVVHKEATLAKEAGYFAFPSALDASACRAFVDVPMGYVEAERGQLAGACRDWYACVTHAAMSDDERTMVLAVPHSPLVTFGDIFRGRWLARLEPAGVAYAYVFNNYWDTNYCAQQSGTLTFAFSLDLLQGPYDPVRAARFGQEAAMAAPDPQAVRLGGSVLDGSELVVTETDKGEDPVGIRVRGAEVFRIDHHRGDVVLGLLNLRDEPVRAVVQADPRRFALPRRSNLVGSGGARLQVAEDGSVEVEIGARAPATLRLKLRESRQGP